MFRQLACFVLYTKHFILYTNYHHILIPGANRQFFSAYSSWRTVINEGTANFDQFSWDSFGRKYPDVSFSKQNTRISQFWSIPNAFPDTVKYHHQQSRLVNNYGLNGGTPCLKRNDGALYFIFANVKLNIEYRFFCGVHTLFSNKRQSF